MKDAPGTRDYDWWLLAILTTICALGVIEIYSATHGSSLVGMHWKQVRWLVIGFVSPCLPLAIPGLVPNAGSMSRGSANFSRCQKWSNWL